MQKEVERLNKQLQKKHDAVEQIRQQLKDSVAATLADYRGLTVAEITKLRIQLRATGVDFKVVKNTLTRRAARELGLEELDPYLEGPTAIAFSPKDPVVSAKVLTDFARTHKALELKGGVLEGKVISLEQVKALASLPPREQLLARVLGGLQTPMVGLVSVLNGPLRNLVYVLDAVRKQKEEA
ncbi:MAG: 50S ribosomal protein L10 [Bacillota bacterium]